MSLVCVRSMEGLPVGRIDFNHKGFVASVFLTNPVVHDVVIWGHRTPTFAVKTVHHGALIGLALFHSVPRGLVKCVNPGAGSPLKAGEQLFIGQALNNCTKITRGFVRPIDDRTLSGHPSFEGCFDFGKDTMRELFFPA